jgi:hypothetical protein
VDSMRRQQAVDSGDEKEGIPLFHDFREKAKTDRRFPGGPRNIQTINTHQAKSCEHPAQ